MQAGQLSHPPVEQEIKRMYARGNIDRQAYYRLLDLAQNGGVHVDDLPHLHKRLRSVPSIDSGLSLEREAQQLREKARRAAEAAFRATSHEEIQAQLEIQQGALYRLQDIEAQITTRSPGG